MDRVIGQFVDYGRNDDKPAEPVLLASLIEDVIAADRLRGLSIETDIDPQATVIARPLPLRRALRNLIDNALKYSPDSAPVRVSVHADDESTRIAVADEGPGVPPREQRDIFRNRITSYNVCYTKLLRSTIANPRPAPWVLPRAVSSRTKGRLRCSISDSGMPGP